MEKAAGGGEEKAAAVVGSWGSEKAAVEATAAFEKGCKVVAHPAAKAAGWAEAW